MTSVTLGRVVAEITGEGEPVVLVHGLGGSSNVFEPQMQALSRWRVIRPDLPGSARSPITFEAPSLDTLAQAVVEAARLAGAESAHFAGHSLGGLLCQHIAARWPERVRSLTLFGAMIEPAESARAGLRQRARTARQEGMQVVADATAAATLSGQTRSANPLAVAFVREILMRQDAESYAKTCEALAAASAAEHRLIRAPTLVLTGDEDPIAPPSVARLLGERIKGAKVAILDRCGHWSTIERPAECSARLADFLRAA